MEALNLTNQGPTTKDLYIDDTLTHKEKFLRYHRSLIQLQRLGQIKLIPIVVESIGFEETVTDIIPLLEEINHDSTEVIVQFLVIAIAWLSKYCVENGGEKGYRIFIDTLLQFFFYHINSSSSNLKQTTIATFSEVLPLFRKEDISTYLLEPILRLSHDEEDTTHETIIMALNLFKSAIPYLGVDLCRQFVLPEFISHAEHINPNVRSVVVTNIPVLMSIFYEVEMKKLNFSTKEKNEEDIEEDSEIDGEEGIKEKEFEELESSFYEMDEENPMFILLECFIRLSKDSHHLVRTFAASNLREISMVVSDEYKEKYLIPTFRLLNKDSSRQVQIAILQRSGMFISSLPKKLINETILKPYLNLFQIRSGNNDIDLTFKHSCAYTFPAIVQCLPLEMWPEVVPLYFEMVNSDIESVKITLGASLHVVANILENEELVESELSSVFESLIQQESEKVRMSVLKNISFFFKYLPVGCRECYMPVMIELIKITNVYNWRLRKILASQLLNMSYLPLRENLFKFIFPLIEILINDPVAEVRNETYLGVATFLRLHCQLLNPSASNGSLSNDSLSLLSDINSESLNNIEISKEKTEEATLELISFTELLETLLESSHAYLRQTWSSLVFHILSEISTEIFEFSFLPGILQLTIDPCYNVRYVLAKFLVGWTDIIKKRFEHDMKQFVELLYINFNTNLLEQNQSMYERNIHVPEKKNVFILNQFQLTPWDYYNLIVKNQDKTSSEGEGEEQNDVENSIHNLYEELFSHYYDQLKESENFKLIFLSNANINSKKYNKKLKKLDKKFLKIKKNFLVETNFNFINKTLLNYNWLLNRSDIKECVNRLSKDNEEIVNILKVLQPLYPDIEFVPNNIKNKSNDLSSNSSSSNMVSSQSTTLLETSNRDPIQINSTPFSLNTNSNNNSNNSSSSQINSIGTEIDIENISVPSSPSANTAIISSILSPGRPRSNSINLIKERSSSKDHDFVNSPSSSSSIILSPSQSSRSRSGSEGTLNYNYKENSEIYLENSSSDTEDDEYIENRLSNSSFDDLNFFNEVTNQLSDAEDQLLNKVVKRSPSNDLLDTLDGIKLDD